MDVILPIESSSNERVIKRQTRSRHAFPPESVPSLCIISQDESGREEEMHVLALCEQFSMPILLDVQHRIVLSGTFVHHDVETWNDERVEGE